MHPRVEDADGTGWGVGVGGNHWLHTSEVRYARRAGAHVAYRVLEGAGVSERDVVFVMAGTMPMDALFDDPVALRLLEGLTELGRLVLFDRRGIGLSDPPPESETAGLRAWCEDIDVVVEAAGVVQPVLVSGGNAAGATVLYCDRHPAAVSSIVLMEPYYGRRVASGDIVRQQIEGEVDAVAVFCPSRADEPGFRDWFLRAGQRGASPGLAARAYPRSADDVRIIEEAARRVGVPIVVLRRPAHPLSPPRATDPFLAMVPHAVRIDLPGEDLFAYGGEVDALVAEVAGFVTGELRVPSPERTLAVILFSDVVASTDRASVLGDTRWKRLLDQHDETARSVVARRGGTIIKHMGDGLIATLTSVTSALRSAEELRAALRVEGLEIRVGIHVGDVDRRADDISGVGVVIAARVQSLAAPGEILVTSTAVQAATGDNFLFEPRGKHQLKGVPAAWHLFALTSAH